MKILITILVFSLTLITAPAQAADLRQDDKRKHVVASAGIATVTYGAARAAKINRWASVIISGVITLGIGYAKETSDPQFDAEDMEANMSGAALGILLPLTFTF